MSIQNYRTKITNKLRYFALRFLERTNKIGHFVGNNEYEIKLDLEGDRAIEWSWVIANIPKQTSKILDFGCTGSILSLTALRLGHKVTGIDLRDIEYNANNLEFINGNLNDIEFHDNSFNIVINCSTVEHVGLSGRYSSKEYIDGDLLAMQNLSKLMADDSKMILTIPVGIDDSFPPLHRVYGEKRLPQLINGFIIEKEEYWGKTNSLSNKWDIISKMEALSTIGSGEYYALGLFVLSKKN